MDNKKSILAVLILLLVIFVPLTIFSVYLKFSGYDTNRKENTPEQNTKKDNQIVENKDKSTYKDGVLYFYDKNKNQIGTYTCKKDPCSYATSLIDDKSYAIDYLANDSEEIPIILDRYAFINDDNQVYLYDVLNNELIGTYKAVKNYNNMTDPSIMIALADNKWGVIKLADKVTTMIPFQYDFIGLTNDLNDDGLLSNEYFVIKSNISWAIVDDSGVVMSNYLTNEISSYNGLLIGIKAGNTYYLYDREGVRVVDEKGFNYVSFVDRYINIVDKDNNLYIYEYGTNNRKIGNVAKLEGNDYKNAFKSEYDESTKTIKVTVRGKEYTFKV